MSLSIVSRVIGVLHQDKRFDDWWEGPTVPIPLLDQHSLPVTFTNLSADETSAFLLDADAALSNFLNIGTDYKEIMAPHIWQNCKEFLEAIGYEEEDQALWDIKQAHEIWSFVDFRNIYVERRHRRDQDIYISLQGECEWEREHGLQLVFRQGRKLTRVSQIDGHLTEADAYDTADAQDELLSAF
ncbi:MAG: hypothetical protein KTR30_34635 [Saprospiraceae bacterium]|nr:hypothetical protein [Saprospiraceae bacterium]